MTKSIRMQLSLAVVLLCAFHTLAVKLEKKMTIMGAPVTGSLPQFNQNWFNTGAPANDVGVSPEGDVYVVGTDEKLYQYNFLANTYTVVEGDKEIPSMNRVDVDADGTPYVVTSCGQIYYLSYNNNWVQLPGCATDIGVGRGGDVWKIGCDTRDGGFGIWKLFCKCTNCKSSCERSNIRFRPMHYLANLEVDKKKCFWYRVEGGAVKIDVHPDGNPWVVTNDGVLYGYDGVNWLRVNGILGRDVTVSNEGMVLLAGTDANIYSLQNAANNLWVQLSGTAMNLSAGPFSQPWVTESTSNLVYTTAKTGYN